MKETGEDYPCGPCSLPLICSGCGEVITKDNVINEDCESDNEDCESDCEICDYCGNGSCPKCGDHWHCGGCI